MIEPWAVLGASVAAFGLALLSAVAGFGGGVLLLPVFTVGSALLGSVGPLTAPFFLAYGLARVRLVEAGLVGSGLLLLLGL